VKNEGGRLGGEKNRMCVASKTTKKGKGKKLQGARGGEETAAGLKGRRK